MTVVAHNPLLPSGQQSVSYNVGSLDTLVDVAAGLAAAMSANSNLQNLGLLFKNDEAAEQHFSQSFAENGVLPAEKSLANISATDAVPTTKTNVNSLRVTSSTSSTLTWDANGNMTSDGTNTYKWDAENRLIEIDYLGIGNKSEFSVDGVGRTVKIIETLSNVVSSTKQLLWKLDHPCEERDGMGSLTGQFFGRGEKIASTAQFYTIDQPPNSIRELCDISGAVQARYSYDPFGRQERSQVSSDSNFRYAGYYFHSPSGLALTLNRPYSAKLARFISRDPIVEKIQTLRLSVEESNLFAYAKNNPINFSDPTGLSYKVCCNDPTVPCPDPAPTAPKPSANAVCAQLGGPGGSTYFLGPNGKGGWIMYLWIDVGHPEGGTYKPTPWSGDVWWCP